MKFRAFGRPEHIKMHRNRLHFSSPSTKQWRKSSFSTEKHQNSLQTSDFCKSEFICPFPLQQIANLETREIRSWVLKGFNSRKDCIVRNVPMLIWDQMAETSYTTDSEQMRSQTQCHKAKHWESCFLILVVSPSVPGTLGSCDFCGKTTPHDSW